MKIKREAASSIGSPGKPKRFKPDNTFSDDSQTHVFKSPSTQKKSKSDNAYAVHLPRQSKTPSRFGSPDEQTHSKHDDSSSVISMSLAYGARNVYDSDDDLLSISEDQKVTNVIKLDTTLLNRDKGVLFSEDLTDDYEIWTCQCPDDVDIRELHEQLIHFDDVSMAKIKNTMSNKVHLIPYKTQEDTSISIVTPSEETNDLSLNIVPLAGKIIITNRVKKEKPVNLVPLPVDTIEDATRRRSELMSKITQRLSNKHSINSIHDINIKEEFIVEKKSSKKLKKKKN